MTFTNKNLSVLKDLGFDWLELKIMGIVISERQKGTVDKGAKFTVRY